MINRDSETVRPAPHCNGTMCQWESECDCDCAGCAKADKQHLARLCRENDAKLNAQVTK